MTIEPKTKEILRDFYKAKAIHDHALQLQHAKPWQRWAHRLVAGRRCPACQAYKRGEHEGWGFYAN